MQRRSLLYKITFMLVSGVGLVACAKTSNTTMMYYDRYGEKAVLNKNKLDNGPHEGLLGIRQYFYPCGSTVLPEKYQAAAKAQAAYLVQHPKALIQIQGFDAAAGSPNYSLAIGQQRANGVANYMRLQGAKALQIAPVSYGAETSMPYNGQLRVQDCRVDIVYLIEQ